MTLTESADLPLGSPAPSFRLPDPDGRHVSLEDYTGTPGLLVVLWCNHCPYVRHVKEAFTDFAREYQGRGLAVVAINANDGEAYPQDSPENMKKDIAAFGYTFSYLIDGTQETARQLGAACTPDFFLFDDARKLVYHGQFDSSRPNNDVPVTGFDLRAACDAVLAGLPVNPDQTPSIGCSIKWRA